MQKKYLLFQSNSAKASATFNSLRSGRPAMRLLIVFLLLVFSGFGNSAVGQQASTSVASSDQADTTAYRILFRQANLYKKLADQADATSTPKPQLRRILAARYGFSNSDIATLTRLALAYQSEVAVIRQQVLTIFRNDQVRFPFGTIPKGADTSPPPELKDLQNQEDALTLHYRNLLRTSMREEDFQKTHAKIIASFNQPRPTK
ncbi:MAG TPA: hypothetical protein VK684_09370 [Edaphobacter sp.]|nr:hypothetical protein [Edaphobacter sp.]